LDIRFVVTSIATGSAEWLYDTLHCARGQAENLIKLHKSQLASDRTSCRSALANQMRLVLHTADDQLRQPDIASLNFKERLALLVDREATDRDNNRLDARLGSPPCARRRSSRTSTCTPCAGSTARCSDSARRRSSATIWCSTCGSSTAASCSRCCRTVPDSGRSA
jgi:hypothetical protein